LLLPEKCHQGRRRDAFGRFLFCEQAPRRSHRIGGRLAKFTGLYVLRTAWIEFAILAE